MKIGVAVVLAIIGTAVVFSLSPGSKAETVPNPPVGRYTVVHTFENRAMMIDTATGAVWELEFGSYCQNKDNPGAIRQVGYAEQCRGDEHSIPNIPEFNRVSVEGLYNTPTVTMIERVFEEWYKPDKRDK
jgi:hypothetical protein